MPQTTQSQTALDDITSMRLRANLGRWEGAEAVFSASVLFFWPQKNTCSLQGTLQTQHKGVTEHASCSACRTELWMLTCWANAFTSPSHRPLPWRMVVATCASKNRSGHQMGQCVREHCNTAAASSESRRAVCLATEHAGLQPKRERSDPNT